MQPIPAKSLNLPYLQHEGYELRLFSVSGAFSPIVSAALLQAGCKKTLQGMQLLHAGRDWPVSWVKIYHVLQQAGLLADVDVEIHAEDGTSTPRKNAAGLQAVADGLWLGEALLEDRLLCYFQPIVNRKAQAFGYESFVRVRSRDGSIIAGDKVIAASRALGIEYMIDRQLHVQAVKTFAGSDCAGFLFVNFFPGFIHRPAVYLEGLSEAVRQYDLVSKNVVLEFTRAEAQRDLRHLKNVCEYGRSKGYSIALDDIVTLEGARALVPEIKPDFVKIDMQPPGKTSDPAWQSTIHKIVELVHAVGGTVIGEGVETEAAYQQLKSVGVDLFQGYLFSPPAPVPLAKMPDGTH